MNKFTIIRFLLLTCFFLSGPILAEKAADTSEHPAAIDAQASDSGTLHAQDAPSGLCSVENESAL